MDKGVTGRHFDVVIIGGGFAGVFCARRVLRRLGHLGKSVGVIAEENHMVFQPMLPEVVGGSLSPRHVVNPIRLLCKGARVMKGVVSALDLKTRTLRLDGGAFSSCVEVSFDHIVLALGAHVDLSRIPGMTEHALLMRNAGDAMKLRAAIIARMEEANLIEDAEARRRLLSFVVVGGGFSGVETAGQMADLLKGVCRYYDRVQSDEPTVTLIHSRERLLATLDESLGEYTLRMLVKGGVKVMLNEKVRAVTARFVMLEGGARLEATTVVCTVGNAPHPLILEQGKSGALPLARGKIVVDATGRVDGVSDAWSAGDCAAFPKANGELCPETAQFAQRQGELLGDNIAASVFGHPLERFAYESQGELAVIGHRCAVASVMGFNFSGFIAWFFWRTVYLSKLPGLDRKLRVVAEWTLDLFFPRDINLLTPRYSSLLEEMHLEPGDPLFHRGEPAFSLYAVKSGRIDIVDETGEVVKSVGEGEHFGERALLDDRTWHFDARAKEASELVAIDARTFTKLVGSMDTLERLFTRSAGQYVTEAEVARMVALLPQEMRTKIAAQIMTRPVITLAAEMTADEALVVFQRTPHSVYPVMDAGGRPLGALRRTALYEWLAHHDLDRSRKVGEMPIAPLLKIAPDCAVPEVLEQLVRNGATKAAVTDANGKLAGIVTFFDLLRDIPKA